MPDWKPSDWRDVAPLQLSPNDSRVVLRLLDEEPPPASASLASALEQVRAADPSDHTCWTCHHDDTRDVFCAVLDDESNHHAEYIGADEE